MPSFTKAADQTVAANLRFTETSDATAGPNLTITKTSDAAVEIGISTVQIALTSNALVSANAPTPPPSGGDVPFPPSTAPLPMPTCSNVNDCFPCFVLPTTNTSAELPDQFLAFSLTWGSLQSNTPPLGFNFRSTGCLSVCESDISQTDADLCAARQQTQCVMIPGPPPPPPPCLSTPCAPPPPPPPPPEPPPLFLSQSASCVVTCSDGLPFTFTVPAGQFIALSQALADQEAASFACREAALHKICMFAHSKSVCLSEPSPMQFIAVGSFLDPTQNLWQLTSGSLPPGYSFTQQLAGSTLTINGTPTQSGVYSFNLRITAPNGDFMEKNFQITVAGITTADPLPNATFNQPYSVTLTADGIDGDKTWNVFSGTLPNGFTLNLLTGEISGVADDNPKGYLFTVNVSNRTTTCSKTFTITLQANFPNVTPDILSNTPSKFADTIPAGTYRVGYVNGSLKYNPAQLWAVNNPFSANGFVVTYLLNGNPVIVDFPALHQDFATQAQAEAANAGITLTIVHSGGGPISIYLNDPPTWADNVPGTPTPTFNLVSL